MPKFLLQLRPIVSPPRSIELLGQHFEQDNFITICFVRMFFPESDSRGTHKGRDATEAVNQLFAHLIEICGWKCLFMIIVQRYE